jgi:hypothetical protein
MKYFFIKYAYGRRVMGLGFRVLGKNIMGDVLLDGGLGVNIVTKDLTKKLGLPFLKPTPYTLRMGN